MHALWVVLLFTGDYNEGWDYVWVVIPSMFALPKMPQSNTHKIKLNFKAIYKHSGFKSQFQSYSQ